MSAKFHRKGSNYQSSPKEQKEISKQKEQNCKGKEAEYKDFVKRF